jgi:glycosyltransferase involved in cell wall biosynthesis
MKIAFFIKSTTFNNSYGGLETQNKILVEGLAGRGHKVIVFTPKGEQSVESIEENGVSYKFVECKTNAYSTLTVPEKDSWIKRSLEVFREEHEREKFELIIGQSSGAVGVIRHREEFGCPIVSISHGTKIGEFQTKFSNDTSLKGLIKSFLETPHVIKNFFTTQREFVHGSDIVVAVSHFVKKSLMDETFVEEEKVRVINNSIKPLPLDGSLEEMEAPRGKIRLLYVGQLIKSKGIEKLAESLLGEDMKEFTLDVVGSGELLGDLKEKAERSAGRITVHGKLPYSEVLKMYDRARFDVLVFPTKRIEGFPMVLVEAMFGGLSVVAFNIGGVSDAVFNNETGYLIPSGRSDLFKFALLNMSNNREEILRMGINARNTATERFSLDKMLDSYEKVFKEVMR